VTNPEGDSMRATFRSALGRGLVGLSIAWCALFLQVRPASAQVDIYAPCREGPVDARVPFAYPSADTASAPAYVPAEDILSLLEELRRLRDMLSPSVALVTPTGSSGNTGSTAAAYADVQSAADAFVTAGDDRRAATLDFKAMNVEAARVRGFRLAQEAALDSYERHERLLASEREAIRAEKDALRALCHTVSTARRLRRDVALEIDEVRRIARSVDRWWALTNALRSELKARYPDFPEESYPLNDFPDLGWNGAHAEIEYGRGIPVLSAARAFHRIDVELQAVNELADYVEAELDADAAKSALVFAQAVHDATAPTCQGDVQCLAPLQADVIAAEGAAARATAGRDAARARFDVTLTRVATLAEFDEDQRAELAQFDERLAGLRREVRRMAPLVERAHEQALVSCAALGRLLDEGLPCLEVPIVPDNVEVSPTTMTESSLSVRDHVFSLFNARFPEPPGYGAYTYVLFSKRREVWETARQTSSRYRALLEAIVDNTDSALEAALPPDQLNLFAIPTELECEGDPTLAEVREACEREFSNSVNARDLDNYDPVLSRAYLAQARAGQLLRPEILDIVRDSPGPFLVTMPQRLTDASQAEGYGPLLFLDLSRISPDAFIDYVAAYKRTVVEAPPVGQVIWEPPRGQWVQNQVLSMSRHFEPLFGAIRDLLVGG
jgi:hypothetical protein